MLSALGAVASRHQDKAVKAAVSEAIDFAPNLNEAIQTGESWVERISKERWSAKKGIVFAGAVVTVGMILYGVGKLLDHKKSR